MKKHLTLRDIKRAGPYSHAVISSNIVYISGQTGFDGKNASNFESQFRNAVVKVKKIAEKAGTSLKNAIKVTVYLSKAEFFDQMNDLFEEYFVEEPARTTIVASFVDSRVLVELDVIAERVYRKK